jgi:hypothetical protein
VGSIKNFLSRPENFLSEHQNFLLYYFRAKGWDTGWGALNEISFLGHVLASQWWGQDIYTMGALTNSMGYPTHQIP